MLILNLLTRLVMSFIYISENQCKSTEVKDSVYAITAQFNENVEIHYQFISANDFESKIAFFIVYNKIKRYFLYLIQQKSNHRLFRIEESIAIKLKYF